MPKRNFDTLRRIGGFSKLKTVVCLPMHDKTENRKIEIGEAVDPGEGRKILLSTEPGGRLIIPQVVNN